MMTPGPSSIDPRVYRALATPLVGHMDPWFTEMIGEVQTLLRARFSDRESRHLSDFRFRFRRHRSRRGQSARARRRGHRLRERNLFRAHGGDRRAHRGQDSSRGSSLGTHGGSGRCAPRRQGPQDQVRRASATGKPPPACSRSSTISARWPTNSARCWWWTRSPRSVGVPLDVDRQRIDICFSGTQKAISAPPGMAPITVSPRMEEVLRSRKTPVQSWYFDLTTTMNFWGKDRTYHHTPPISIVYALREALRIVFEEGLEAGWQRHRQNQLALIAVSKRWASSCSLPNPEDRLPTVTTVHVPAGVRRSSRAAAVARRIRHRNRRRHRRRSRARSGASA